MLIRINRDWETLEEEEQISLRNEIVHFLAQASLSPSARSKLEEALVRVMERAGSWWKDPIGELLHIPSPENLRLLSLLAALTSFNDSTAYRWQHQIKEAAPKLLLYLQAFPERNQLWLECLRNWIAFGAFNFSALIPILPRVFEASGYFDVVDVLVEACELPTRDQAEEAKKLECFLPFLERQRDALDENDLSRIVGALAESTAVVLVSRCADAAVQQVFRLLLSLTDCEGVAGVEEDSSALLLTAWYLICEAAGEVDIPANQQLIISILAALAPILIKKATVPDAHFWSSLPRDQQQQFMQVRREYLDTMLYLQRVFQSFGSAALVQFLYDGLLRRSGSSLTVSAIEVRLRALIVIAEESEEWSPQWSAILSCLFDPSTGVAVEPVNAKLAISLVGNLLPCMETDSATEAVQMLLNQLDNPAITEECLAALQQAVDCEVPCLQRPETITQLIQKVNQSTAIGFIRFLCRLLSECPCCSDAERFEMFCQFILGVPPLTLDQLTCAFKTFQLPKQEFLNPDALHQLFQQRIKPVNEAGLECFIAALESVAKSGPFALDYALSGNKNRQEAMEMVLSVLSTAPIMQANRILGAAVLAWTRDAADLVAAAIQRFFSHHHQFRDMNDQDEAAELLMDTCIRMGSLEVSVLDALSALFHNYALGRLVSGSLSVPILRTITRFICFLVEHDQEGNSSGVFCGDYSTLTSAVLSAGMTGSLGRSGMEIASRILYEVSLKNPTLFAKLLAQSVGPEERVFLRSIGAAHTFKKFKTVLVDFCIKVRTGE